MANLTTNLNAGMGVVEVRHNALINAVQHYRNNTVQSSADDLQAAESQTVAELEAKEKSVLGLAAMQSTAAIPSMLSDFAGGHYMLGTRRLERGVAADDMWECRRSTPKWVMGSDKKLVEVPPDTLAIDHDPKTGASLGVLVEDGSENSVWPSAFGMSRGSRTVVSMDNPYSGVGVKTYKVTPGAGVSNGYAFTNGLSAEAGETVSISLLFKPGTYTNALTFGWYGGSERSVSKSTRVSIDPSTGLVTGTSRVTDYSATQMTGGWVLLTATTVTDSSGPVGAVWYSHRRGDGSKHFYVAAPQVERGKPSSHIPTTNASVSRDSEILFRRLGDEFPGGSFSISGVCTQGAPKHGAVFSLTSDEGSYLRIGFPSNGGKAMWSNFGDVSLPIDLSNFPGYTQGDEARFALSVNVPANLVRLAINGEVASYSRDLNGYTRMRWMRAGGLSASNNNLQGHVRGLTVHPHFMTGEELQELTQNG